MSGTLPLFDDLETPASAPESPVPGGSRGTGERHLRAAWRLSRRMRRLPERSAEQTRAGLAICHHLQALLAASDDTP